MRMKFDVQYTDLGELLHRILLLGHRSPKASRLPNRRMFKVYQVILRTLNYRLSFRLHLDPLHSQSGDEELRRSCQGRINQ